jgi:hypothetical protein
MAGKQATSHALTSHLAGSLPASVFLTVCLASPCFAVPCLFTSPCLALLCLALPCLALPCALRCRVLYAAWLHCMAQICKLRHLNISHNQLPLEACRLIAAALTERNLNLQCVHMAGNAAGLDGKLYDMTRTVDDVFARFMGLEVIRNQVCVCVRMCMCVESECVSE